MVALCFVAALCFAAALFSVALYPVALHGAEPTGKLKEVLERGQLYCGVNGKLSGFGFMDPQGNMVGFDVDICRAVAAALFDDPAKVRFTPLSAPQRFTALQSGEIDLLSRNTTWTISRDSRVGLDFAPVVFYDGQGIMVKRELGVSSVSELDGASICVQTGTTTEKNLTDYFRNRGIAFNPVISQDYATSVDGFIKDRCDAFTTDRSGLLATKIKYPELADAVILDEVMSKEPLAPAVVQGESQWRDAVAWIVFGLIQAEELGVTQENIQRMSGSTDLNVRRLLGIEDTFGEDLGLSNDFLARTIRHVGNYGEIYERHLGMDSPFKLPRGLNDLWSRGGLMYAPPFR